MAVDENATKTTTSSDPSTQTPRATPRGARRGGSRVRGGRPVPAPGASRTTATTSQVDIAAIPANGAAAVGPAKKARRPRGGRNRRPAGSLAKPKTETGAVAQGSPSRPEARITGVDDNQAAAIQASAVNEEVGNRVAGTRISRGVAGSSVDADGRKRRTHRGRRGRRPGEDSRPLPPSRPMSLVDIARAAAAAARAEQRQSAGAAKAPVAELPQRTPPAARPAAFPEVPVDRSRAERSELQTREFSILEESAATGMEDLIEDRDAPQLVEFDDSASTDTRLYSDIEVEPAAEVETDGDDETPDDGEREMVINVSEGSEVRIAVMHEGRLEELFIERESSQSHVGNIYKGRVTNVEPSIQAAFVDFGLQKNGFLHISDVQPQYFPNHSGGSEDVGRKIPRHHRPPIQKCFRRGEEVIVQITKEGVGTKGPTLTSYLSIPGRFLVMMPGMSRHGVSRKIEDEDARRKMRDVLNELDLPAHMGFILRTAGMGRTKRDLQRDLHYLMRLWKTVVERIKRLPAPAELYRESDLVIRTIRDVYNSYFRRIVIDDPATASRVGEFLQIAMPRGRTDVEVYSEREPLFHRMGIEAEIEKINMRHVPLKSGGSLVIDSTEALVAIDVNSGRFRTIDDAEETAVRINVEAAEEIARQLRLRDLGGLIVCDFIDMRLDRNKRKVEQALREALKKHKERARTLRMSAFGLIEMTRQRQGPSIKRNIYYDCTHCRGSGLVKMPESVMLDALRTIQLCVHNPAVHKVTMTLAGDIAFQVLNNKRTTINQIEAETGKLIVVRGDANFTSDQMEYACEDNRGRPVTVSQGIRA